MPGPHEPVRAVAFVWPERGPRRCRAVRVHFRRPRTRARPALTGPGVPSKPPELRCYFKSSVASRAFRRWVHSVLEIDRLVVARPAVVDPAALEANLHKAPSAHVLI
jgi:hypothetical protein